MVLEPEPFIPIADNGRVTFHLPSFGFPHQTTSGSVFTSLCLMSESRGRELWARFHRIKSVSSNVLTSRTAGLEVHNNIGEILGDHFLVFFPAAPSPK